MSGVKPDSKNRGLVSDSNISARELYEEDNERISALVLLVASFVFSGGVNRFFFSHAGSLFIKSFRCKFFCPIRYIVQSVTQPVSVSISLLQKRYGSRILPARESLSGRK